MAVNIKNVLKVTAAPLLSVLLLAGIAADRGTRISPQDVVPYHAYAQSIIGLQTDGVEGKISHFVDHERDGIRIGTWIGKDDFIPSAAQQLLRPNGILSRTYTFDGSDDLGQAKMLVVQCRDSRDMLGHYPPICYRAHGEEQTGAKRRDWRVGNLLIPGMAYTFVRNVHGRRYSQVVYNFLIVPGQGPVPDMESLRDASEYYERRAYGAAQFQVVMPDSLDEAKRDEIFKALMTPNVKLIRELAYPQRASS